MLTKEATSSAVVATNSALLIFFFFFAFLALHWQRIGDKLKENSDTWHPCSGVDSEALLCFVDMFRSACLSTKYNFSLATSFILWWRISVIIWAVSSRMIIPQGTRDHWIVNNVCHVFTVARSQHLWEIVDWWVRRGSPAPSSKQTCRMNEWMHATPYIRLKVGLSFILSPLFVHRFSSLQIVGGIYVLYTVIFFFLTNLKLWFFFVFMFYRYEPADYTDYI